MRIKDVFILEEAVDDLNEGKSFVVAVLPMRRDPAWIVEQLKK
jgi:hypothetical protein